MASLANHILTDNPSTEEVVVIARMMLAAALKEDFQQLYAMSKALWVGNELITHLARKGYVGNPTSLTDIMKTVPDGTGPSISLQKLAGNINSQASKPSDDPVNDDDVDQDDDDNDDDFDDDDYDDAYDDDYEDGDYNDDEVSVKISQLLNKEKPCPSFNEEKLVFWLESLFSNQREHSHKFIVESAKNLGLITYTSQLVRVIAKLPVVVGMDMSKTDSSEDPLMVVAKPGWPEKTNEPWWMTGAGSMAN